MVWLTRSASQYRLPYGSWSWPRCCRFNGSTGAFNVPDIPAPRPTKASLSFMEMDGADDSRLPLGMRGRLG
jgi:hypothetical protein